MNIAALNLIAALLLAKTVAGVWIYQICAVGFDLAGVCVCPDCLTMGKAKAMIKSRKVRQRQRSALTLRK